MFRQATVSLELEIIRRWNFKTNKDKVVLSN